MYTTIHCPVSTAVSILFIISSDVNRLLIKHIGSVNSFLLKKEHNDELLALAILNPNPLRIGTVIGLRFPNAAEYDIGEPI